MEPARKEVGVGRGKGEGGRGMDSRQWEPGDKKAKICRIIKTNKIVFFFLVIKYNIQFLSEILSNCNGLYYALQRGWLYYCEAVDAVGSRSHNKRKKKADGSDRQLFRGMISSGQVLVVLWGTKTNRACHIWARCMTLVQTYRKVFIYIQIMSENTIGVRDHFALLMILHIIYNNM